MYPDHSLLDKIQVEEIPCFCLFVCLFSKIYNYMSILHHTEILLTVALLNL